MFLTFANKKVEKEYHKNREKISSLTLLPIAIINIVDAICSFYMFTSNKGLILQVGPSMIIMAVAIVFMAESCGVELNINFVSYLFKCIHYFLGSINLFTEY